ncbi:hypothetical protein FACS1894204_04420 [Synergistales bacterium]|nr:hypothetical protein FACS1894204_04420 [Synergistales bacterium]
MGRPQPRKLWILTLIASFFVQHPRAVGAGDSVAQLTILAGELTALEVAYELDHRKRSEIWNVEKGINSRDIYELVYDTTAFTIDHVAMSESDRVSPDYAGKINSLYSKLSNAGELSFGSSANFPLPTRSVANVSFNRKNPGYDDLPGLDGDYYAKYMERVKDVRTYAKGVISGVSGEILEIGTTSADIKKLNDALYGLPNIPANDTIISTIAGLIGRGGDLASLAAAAGEAVAGSSGRGYRSLMQTSNQAANYNNMILSKLRVDVMRQLEAETQLALYAQQERTVIQAAFEQAVKASWEEPTSSGIGY